MSLQFTKEEVEHAINDLLVHGDRRDIAQISGLGESLIKRQLNPDDDVPSSIYVALQIICALDEKDPDRGEAAWRKICEMRELSKKRRLTNLCSEEETGKFNLEVAEFISAKINGKPFNEQIKEFLDIEFQMAHLKQALLDDYNRAKDDPRNTQSAMLKAV